MKMFKLISILVFLTILLSSCGVNTSSSSTGSIVNEDQETVIESDLINPNPIIDTDTNSTDDTNTSTDVVDTGTDTLKEDSQFDTNDAIYDANACKADLYFTARDASYNGDDSAENGASFFSVVGQGLELRSEYLDGDSSNNSKTIVTLFYKSFPDQKHFNIQGYTSYLREGEFILSYDIAWSDFSITGIDRTLYVQSNKSTKPTCYRLVLNTALGSEIDVKKVYR